MMHGTSDNKRCWCGAWTDDVGGWIDDYYQVECVECLRVKIHDLQAVVDAAREMAEELDRYGIQQPICETNLHYFKRMFLRALDGEVKT
jgi:hypothetical protein